MVLKVEKVMNASSLLEIVGLMQASGFRFLGFGLQVSFTRTDFFRSR
jgi:hypothetical protein